MPPAPQTVANLNPALTLRIQATCCGNSWSTFRNMPSTPLRPSRPPITSPPMTSPALQSIAKLRGRWWGLGRGDSIAVLNEKHCTLKPCSKPLAYLATVWKDLNSEPSSDSTSSRLETTAHEYCRTDNGRKSRGPPDGLSKSIPLPNKVSGSVSMQFV